VPGLWRLHLALARLLTRRGEETDDEDCFRQALDEVKLAKKAANGTADVYYHAGVIQRRLKEYKRALDEFRTCLRRDPDNFDAQQSARALTEYLSDQSREKGRLDAATAMIVLVAFCHLVALWVLFLRHQVSSTLVTTLAPVLIGLMIIGFLLESLVALRLPGLQADLAQPQAPALPPPKADISFGGSTLSLESRSSAAGQEDLAPGVKAGQPTHPGSVVTNFARGGVDK
jgi:tetratricopeptide (TPR) repeat protein